MSKIVGKKLRQAREELNISLEQVAGSTHIRLRFLESMEAGDFGALPSPVQIRGFIRSYGGYLGLDVETLIEAVDMDPWSALDALNEDSEPAKGEPDSPVVDSASSFAAIGEMLISQRELLGLSLADVEQHTHLRLKYLKALDAGDFDELPSPVQGRGMLKNYAAFIGLDADQLLLKYAEGLQARLAEGQSEEPAQQPRQQKRPPQKKKRRFLNREMIVGGFIIFFISFFIVWGALQVSAMIADQESVPTPPSIADILLPSSTPSPLPAGTSTIPSPLEGGANGNGDSDETSETNEEPAAEETQVIIVSENIDGAVQVQIIIRQRAWMRITVDGNIEYDGRVITGSAYAFAGEEVVEISTGNGAGLQVYYNDLDLGTLGDYGEVINFVITVNGVQTPTPTITLTPTETLEPTVTPTP